ncbi:hypothetical protein GCM10020256_05170 [Streptomyces thermocoprophilus]
MGEDDRVVVDVDDPGLGGVTLGDLVGVVGGGQAGADVEELPYAGLGDEVAHGAAEEPAVGLGVVADARVQLADLVAGLLVDFVVVLAAKPVVPDPGGVRLVGLDPLVQLARGGGLGHAMTPVQAEAVSRKAT